jgi:hypothetical protein
MGWFNRDERPSTAVPAVPLKPGTCECEHSRCCHERGTGQCHVQYEPHTEDNKTDKWSCCACQIFILDDDNGNDDTPEVPVDPELAELEKMAR